MAQNSQQGTQGTQGYTITPQQQALILALTPHFKGGAKIVNNGATVVLQGWQGRLKTNANVVSNVLTSKGNLSAYAYTNLTLLLNTNTYYVTYQYMLPQGQKLSTQVLALLSAYKQVQPPAKAVSTSKTIAAQQTTIATQQTQIAQLQQQIAALTAKQTSK